MDGKLIQILDVLFDKNTELYDLFQEERHCLINNDVTGLKKVNVREMEVGAEIAQIERFRISLIRDFCEQNAIGENAIKLADICQYLDQNYAPVIMEKGDALRALLEQMMHLRNFNNEFLSKIIKFNQKNIQLFMGLGKKALTYDDAGVINHSRKQILDSVI